MTDKVRFQLIPFSRFLGLLSSSSLLFDILEQLETWFLNNVTSDATISFAVSIVVVCLLALILGWIGQRIFNRGNTYYYCYITLIILLSWLIGGLPSVVSTVIVTSGLFLLIRIVVKLRDNKYGETTR